MKRFVLGCGCLALGALMGPPGARAISVAYTPDATDDPSLDATQLLGTTTYPWSIDATNERLIGQRGDAINEAAIVVDGQTILIGFNNTGVATSNVGYVISADGGTSWRDQYTPVTFRNPYAADLNYSSDPTVAQCVDHWQHHKLLAGSVAFNSDLTAGGAFHCDADNAFVLTGTIDRGVHWDITHAVGAGPGLLRDRPFLACDPFSSRCWAMFNGYPEKMDGSGICDEGTGSVTGSSLYVSTSNDCGDTWTPPTPVSGTHQAATNLVVLRNGHTRFALWRQQWILDVFDCDPAAGCTVLDEVSHEVLATGDDHAHVQGLPRTRLNSMPVIGCKDDGTRCTVAWMNQFGYFSSYVFQALILYTTTVDGGATWSAPAMIPQWNADRPDQVLPVLSWGYNAPGLCWYQREALVGNAGDHRFHMLCAPSNDGGLTWVAPPVEVDEPVDISVEPTLATQSFLGDYNQLDAHGGWFAYTGMLWPPASQIPVTIPLVRMARWTPDRFGCQVGPAGAAAWWLALVPGALLLGRRRVVAVLGLLSVLGVLLLTRAAVAQDGCMGDCNDDGRVTIDELVLNVAFALGTQPVDGCANPVDFCTPLPILCMTRAVNNALDSCPVPAPPPP